MNTDAIVKQINAVPGDKVSFFEYNGVGRPSEIKPNKKQDYWSKEALIEALTSGRYPPGNYQVGQYGVKGTSSRKKLTLNLEMDQNSFDISDGPGSSDGEMRNIEVATTTPDYIVALLGNQLGSKDDQIRDLLTENAKLRETISDLRVELERTKGESRVQELETGDSIGRILGKVAEGEGGKIVIARLMENFFSKPPTSTP